MGRPCREHPVNPFPGMNPWLEGYWGDVHTSPVTYARDALQDVLPGGLRARAEERVFIESGEDLRPAKADVHRLPSVEVTERYVGIIDTRSGGRVITVIEFVSRSNKAPGPGRDLYQQKQQDARRGGTNLVEIDLLRGGQPVTLAPPHLIPPNYRTLYHACAWRVDRPKCMEYYPIPLRHPLPKVRIPLRPGDADATLDLQPLVDRAYERGGYDDVNYAQPPDPPLGGDDAAWARDVLTAAGLAGG